jgi:hypothetical protein
VKSKPVLSSLLILAAVVLMCGMGLADTIKLKNGSIIKGKVVSYNQQEFTVVLDLGSASRRSTSRMVIAIEDVESIEFDVGEGPVGPTGAELSAKRGETAREISTSPRATETAPVERETAKEPVEAPQVTSTGAAESLVAAEKNVSVVAAADWTSTEIRVRKGQRISITASGEVDLGNNQRTGPEGASLTDSRKLIPARPTGALIAVVGDDNDDFVFIGRAAEFTAAHNGILFLSVNEGNLKDNSGAFLARVKVYGSK